MCRSFRTSVLTGLYSYLVAAFLFWRGSDVDFQMSIVIFAFSTIQILEAMIWWSIENSSEYSYSLNRLGTSLIPFVLSLELIVSLFVMSYYLTPTNNELTIYLVFVLFMIILWFKNREEVTTVDPQTGSLLWGQRDINFLLRILFLMLLVYPLLKLSHPIFQIFAYGSIATFIYSFKYKETFGSNWCWISNILSTFALFPY